MLLLVHWTGLTRFKPIQLFFFGKKKKIRIDMVVSAILYQTF